MRNDTVDCLIIGGGPAGATAAIYLARFHLAVAMVDAGDGRCAMIPRTHNHAGYPEGIAGTELLARMHRQARDHGATLHDGRVEMLARDGDGFVASAGDRLWHARSVLLATGVRNRRPPMDEAAHDAALAQGLIRYCPICDGYEVTDKRIGVLGTGDHGRREAEFLRGYSRDVTLIATDAAHDLSAADRAALAAAGIALFDGPCEPLVVEDAAIAVPTADGRHRFDTVYPALGSDIHSELAVALGAEVADAGCLKVDAHRQTSVPGLFAAGDVVLGLDQISAAMGDAGIAATAIRNQLAERAPMRR